MGSPENLGGIVNDSRTWAMMVGGYVRKKYLIDDEVKTIHRRLVRRHIAWLHALRFQLRTSKPWEHKLTEKESKHYPQSEEKSQHKHDVVSL